jgi:hypothetical protein
MSDGGTRQIRDSKFKVKKALICIKDIMSKGAKKFEGEEERIARSLCGKSRLTPQGIQVINQRSGSSGGLFGSKRSQMVPWECAVSATMEPGGCCGFRPAMIVVSTMLTGAAAQRYKRRRSTWAAKDELPPAATADSAATEAEEEPDPDYFNVVLPVRPDSVDDVFSMMKNKMSRGKGVDPLPDADVPEMKNVKGVVLSEAGVTVRLRRRETFVPWVSMLSAELRSSLCSSLVEIMDRCGDTVVLRKVSTEAYEEFRRIMDNALDECGQSGDSLPISFINRGTRLELGGVTVVTKVGLCGKRHVTHPWGAVDGALQTTSCFGGSVALATGSGVRLPVVHGGFSQKKAKEAWATACDLKYGREDAIIKEFGRPTGLGRCTLTSRSLRFSLRRPRVTGILDLDSVTTCQTETQGCFGGHLVLTVTIEEKLAEALLGPGVTTVSIPLSAGEDGHDLCLLIMQQAKQRKAEVASKVH